MQTIGKLTAGVLKAPPASQASRTNSTSWRPRLDEYHEDLATAADEASRFIAHMEAGLEPYWLTFAGDTGVGKTFIARQTYLEGRKHNLAATANWQPQTGIYDERKRRPDCRWIDAAGFARLFLDDKQYDLPEFIAHEWLVGFDDLGSETGNAKAKESLAPAFYRLANLRLGKWTIWTTNFTLEEISERIDPRVASRLIRDSNRLVTIQAPDYARTGRKFSAQRS